MDPKPFTDMAARRAAADPESAVRLVVDNPVPVEPEPVGAPVPGAIAVLAITALLLSASLGIARAMGVDLPWVIVFAPMWSAAVLLAGIALACAIPAAASDAREWVRRRGQ